MSPPAGSHGVRRACRRRRTRWHHSCMPCAAFLVSDGSHCRAEAAQEEKKQDAARRRKKDEEVADKMRLLSEARQAIERELERRVDGLERQARLFVTSRGPAILVSTPSRPHAGA